MLPLLLLRHSQTLLLLRCYDYLLPLRLPRHYLKYLVSKPLLLYLYYVYYA